MMLGSFAAVEIPVSKLGGKFCALLGAQAVVNHVLSTVMHDSAVVQLIVAQSLQRPNQCLPSSHTTLTASIHLFTIEGLRERTE